MVNLVERGLNVLGLSTRLIIESSCQNKWIESFLTSRTQRVVANAFLSEPYLLISGVPQGSFLGPLLFLILLSAIDKNIASSFLSSFADDSRILKGVSDVANASALQKYL